MRRALLLLLLGVFAAGAWWWQRAPTPSVVEAEVVAPPPTTAPQVSAATSAPAPVIEAARDEQRPPADTGIALSAFDARWLDAENGDANAAYEVATAVLECVLNADEPGQAGASFAGAQMSCEDIPTDRSLADRLLRAAAEAGHVAASREYAAHYITLSGVDLSRGARGLSQNDVVTLAARDYQAMDYLEFAATQGDVAAAKLLASRLASGFALDGVADASILVGMRNSEPEQALAWHYAVQIVDGDQRLAAERARLREALDAQQILQAQARGQELYSEHFTP